MPKVIIMMSTYNGEKYLAEQIESILNQTEKDFVLEIHDDGSTDGTLEIIKAYAQKDKRICIDNSGHKGYPKCFFDLMKDAGEAKYYAFSDQDDVWLPNKIERAISFIDNEESPALYGAGPYTRQLYRIQTCCLRRRLQNRSYPAARRYGCQTRTG